MEIVEARPQDAQALTDIAFAAKSHWGYPAEWVRSWERVLTVTPDYVLSHPTFMAVDDGQIVGFCALQFQSGEAGLDHMWVLPRMIGGGVGRALFARAEDHARRSGSLLLKIVSDPNSEGFYHRMGATTTGREWAHMDGQERYLPILEKPL
ncbi:MAG TPA: GNAT family N-acetyltransferase [Opitutaceae bacterium]|jgi:GNAT superfamily N-acetyltransferase